MVKLGSFFVTGKRDNGESFTTLRDDRPEWLQDAVREAHAGDFPNDWIYSECRAACEAIDAGDLSDDDNLHEHADSRVDVYTRHLYQWAADFCLSDTWANAESEVDDMGTGPMVGVTLPAGSSSLQRITTVQYCARATIARIMLSAAQDNAEDDETDDEAGDRLMRANEARRAKGENA
jgi:hypothetical protein